MLSMHTKKPLKTCFSAMSNFFDFRRFGKYFVYDLKTAFCDCRATFLVMGLMPAIWFSIYELISILTTGHFIMVEGGAKLPVFVMVIMASVIVLPTRHYGLLTDKRRGADWLMIPSSAFEKFLSLLMVCCVAAPVALMAVYLLCDWILSLIPYYGGVTFALRDAFTVPTFGSEGSELALGITPAQILWLNWCEYVLIFALGAVCFKKAKVAKTILCIFAAVMVLLSLIGLVAGRSSLDMEDLRWLGTELTPEKISMWFNILVNGLFLVVFTLLNLGLYFRIKTIKH